MSACPHVARDVVRDKCQSHNTDTYSDIQNPVDDAVYDIMYIFKVDDIWNEEQHHPNLKGHGFVDTDAIIECRTILIDSRYCLYGDRIWWWLIIYTSSVLVTLGLSFVMLLTKEISMCIYCYIVSKLASSSPSNCLLHDNLLLDIYRKVILIGKLLM